MADFTRKNPTDNTELIGTVLAAPSRPHAVVALVHGFGEHAGRHRDHTRDLGEAGFAVLGIDLHGHGRTAGPRGRVDAYERLREDVDLLIAEARTRYPGLPLILYGHSMGGGLVLDYVLDRGAKRLAGVVVTAPLIETPDAPPALLVPVLRLIRKLHPGFSIATPIASDKISTLPEEQLRYESDSLNHDRLGVGLGLDMLENGKALLNRAKDLPLPLLLMHARGDQLTSFEASERFAARVPDCNFIALEGVEHEIHNDTSRAAVIRHVAEFAERLS